MQYIAGIALAVFLLLLLVLKKTKSVADHILTIWIALIVVHQLLFYLDYTGFSYRYPHLLGLTFPLPLLHGILLFFYVLSITKAKPIRFRTALIHCIPVLLLIVLAIPFYALPGADKVNVFENRGLGYEWYNLLKIIIIVVVGLVYVIWSLLLIRKHRSNIQEFYSNTDKKNLQWLEYLSIGLGIIWLLAAFFDDQVIFTAVFVLVLFIGFFGINQLPIFYSGLIPVTDGSVDAKDPDSRMTVVVSARYEKSGLKEEEGNRVYEHLQALMNDEALYKNNELTLSELSEKLDIHPNYLSQIINQKENKNFYHYINTLRVEEFIRLMSQPESKRYTLLALAFDCGFNSKSTFNKYFKHHTGKTPSEYFRDR